MARARRFWIGVVGRLGLALVAVIAAFGAPAGAAREQNVSLRYGDLVLNGRLVVPGSKPLGEGVVLMVHGTLAHHGMDTIRGLQETFADRGIATLAITLGLGRSNRRGMYPCAVPHRHRHTDALDEIAAWIDWLGGKGAGSLVLFGHSRGGNQVAWYMAERKDRRVARVILLAPMTWSEGRARGTYMRRHGRPLDEVLARAKALVAAGKGDQLMHDTGFLFCPGATVTAETFVSYYGPDPRRDTPALLPRIPAPVLIVAAGQDAVVPDLVPRVRPLADGRRIRLVVVEDADHFFLDLFAEDVADAVSEFLAP